uniref:CENP-V/GFA domain-containing protein n=1 Tax=Streptomyces sp. NBC_00049 TaxID=2903617 RepID=A0AAU2JJI7_9ACTN
MTGHGALFCQGCSGQLYAVCTTDRPPDRGNGSGRGGKTTGEWEVDHEMPVLCPLSALLPLTGKAASVHDLPGAQEVLGPPG